MQQAAEPARATHKRLRRFGLAVGALLIGVTFLLVAGAHLPSLPYLGVFGSLGLSLWPAWFVVAAATGGLMVLQSGRGMFRWVLIALALASTLGVAVVMVRVTAVARENGVQPTLAQAFGFSGSLDTVDPDEVVEYTRELGQALTLRIYRPKGRAPLGGWPVYMHIHGGGWIEGSNAEQSADMRWFADRGWVVVSVGYSLSGERRHLWDRVIGQIGCAMAWTDANIAARGGDAKRLAMRGSSAGGNLALNAAYLANAGKLRSVCGGRVPQVRSVTPIYPGVDLVAIYRNTYPMTGPDVRDMVTKYIGGSPQKFPDRYAAVGSGSHISADAPPTLMFISENDHLVPLESMRTFAEKARGAGVSIRTISIPHAEHGFDATGIGNAIVRQASLRFINEHDRVRQ